MVFRQFKRPELTPITQSGPVCDANGVMSVRHLRRETRGPAEALMRGMAQTAYLGKGLALCRVLGRYKFFVDTCDIGLAPHLMLDGFWEMWVTEAIVSLVQPGMVVADIGANVGYYTMLMAELVGVGGIVHGFEPNPQVMALMTRNVSINGFWPQVRVHRIALGDENERDVTLVVPPGEPKNGYTVPLDRGEHGVPVPSARLDSQTDWQDIDFAKIDVEGAEELVWAGMQGLLDGGRLKNVLLEFCPRRYADAAGFLAALLAPGFSLARVDPYDGIVDMRVADVLAADPNEDIMLILRR